MDPVNLGRLIDCQRLKWFCVDGLNQLSNQLSPFSWLPALQNQRLELSLALEDSASFEPSDQSGNFLLFEQHFAVFFFLQPASDVLLDQRCAHVSKLDHHLFLLFQNVLMAELQNVEQLGFQERAFAAVGD